MRKTTPARIWLLFLMFFPYPTLLHSMQRTVEFRAAGFYHTSKEFRDIYKDWGVSYEIEASLSCNCCYAWWANLSWFDQGAEANADSCALIPIGCLSQNSTKARIVNLSLGIKFPYCICEGLVGYVGIGPSFGNIWLKNQNCILGSEEISKFAFGGVVKVGVDFYLTQCLFLDFFIDYLYQPVHFRSQVDIGGIKTGIGLGLSF